MHKRLVTIIGAALLSAAFVGVDAADAGKTSVAPVDGKCPEGYQLVTLSIGGQTCRKK